MGHFLIEFLELEVACLALDVVGYGCTVLAID